ncbi:MAG TPA: universal stress protein, partial [Thermoleophilia bacterium]|nr:universal stress protein [Thermoleophilia bacterium]
MSYTIVVGYDGSAQSLKALDAAVEIAKLMADGQIMIACAQDRPAPAIGFRGPEIGVEEMWEEAEKQIQAELDLAAGRVREAGVKVATACTPDRPDVAVVNIAQDAGARMIVVGTKGAGAREGQ